MALYSGLYVSPRRWSGDRRVAARVNRCIPSLTDRDETGLVIVSEQ
jgi:hypothetical protein